MADESQQCSHTAEKISVRLPLGTLAKLDRLAAKRGRLHRSEVVRQAIDELQERSVE